MAKKYPLIINIIKYCMILILPFILPIIINKLILNIIIKPIHNNINKNIPNTLKIILPTDITLGEFADFIINQKQPKGMNNQIYSVAVQRLKDPLIVQKAEKIKFLNYLSHDSLKEIRNYQLFETFSINTFSILFNFIAIIIIISLVFWKVPESKLPLKINNLFLLALLLLLIFINIALFIAVTLYYIINLKYSNNYIKNLYYLPVTILSTYLIINNQLTLEMGITFIILYNRFAHYLKLNKLRT